MDNKQNPQPPRPTPSPSPASNASASSATTPGASPANKPTPPSISDIKPTTTPAPKPANTTNTTTNTSNTASKPHLTTPRPGAYTDPLVRPTVELPTRPSYQSKDIGTKTAVQIDPFVKVEDTFGNRLRKFFHLKPKGNKTEKSKTENLSKEQKAPQLQTTSTNSTQNSKDVVKITTPGTSTVPQQAPTTQTPSKAPGQKSTPSSPDKSPKALANKPNFASTLKSLLHFLFAGLHKFLTIPLALIILAETVVIILFLTGVFGSNNTPAPSTEELITNTNEEATKIYNNITNLNSEQDVFDYWNTQISIVEAVPPQIKAYKLRMEAADFYLARDDREHALAILQTTQIDYSIGIPELYRLYSTISCLASNLNHDDIAQEYLEKTAALSNGAGMEL